MLVQQLLEQAVSHISHCHCLAYAISLIGWLQHVDSPILLHVLQC